MLGEGLGAAAPYSTFHYRLQGWVLAHLDGVAAPSDAWRDAEERDRALTTAVATASGDLRARLGPDIAAWQWGALHRIRFDHALRSAPAIGRRLSRGPYPFGGDVNTIAQGGYSLYRGSDANAFTPAYRQVIDLADPDRSRFILPAGNSGIPGHPRYDDCIDDYLAGRRYPLDLLSREFA